MLRLLLCDVPSQKHFRANSALTQERLSNAEYLTTIPEHDTIIMRKQILDISNCLGGVALQRIYEGKDSAFYY